MEITKGDTFPFIVTVKDADGVIFDLTGYTMNFMAKSDLSLNDEDAEIAKTATISTPASGQGEIKLLPADTTIDVKRYWYDVQLSNAGGDIYTVINKQPLLITEQVIRGS